MRQKVGVLYEKDKLGRDFRQNNKMIKGVTQKDQLSVGGRQKDKLSGWKTNKTSVGVYDKR